MGKCREVNSKSGKLKNECYRKKSGEIGGVWKGISVDTDFTEF